MIDRAFSGRMHLFGDNIDTDQIYPGQYLDVTDHEEMARHAMQGASPHFARDSQPGDILVAGRNFGCGSSRENAAIALKASRVGCVIAQGFARIFYRNAINLGLPLVVCPQADQLGATGDPLAVDLRAGTVTNTATGQCFAIEPISAYALSILDAGGIKPLMKAQEAP